MKLLELPDNVYDDLIAMSDDYGLSVSEILTQGMALGKLSILANTTGKYLGIASDPDVLENRFVGFFNRQDV